MIATGALKYRPFLVALVGGFLFWAGTAAAAAQLKIGYVDAQRVLKQAPQAQAMLDKLEKEFEPRKEKVMNTQDKLQRVEDKLSRDGDIMSDSERIKIQHQAVTLRRNLKRDQQDFQDDLNMRRNEELGKLQNLVNQAIRKIGGEGNYDLILYDGIAYAKNSLDLTDKVLDYLAKRAKKPASAKK